MSVKISAVLQTLSFSNYLEFVKHSSFQGRDLGVGEGLQQASTVYAVSEYILCMSVSRYKKKVKR
jgi:hypothetical protein